MLPWSLRRIGNASDVIVTVDQAKRNLRLPLDCGEQDLLIADKIEAATAQVEYDSGLALSESDYQIGLDYWPGRSFVLPVRPVSAVLSIKTANQEGSLTELDPSDYWFDVARNLVTARDTWPAVTPGPPAPITIDVTAGPLTGSVNTQAREAVLLQVGAWFHNPSMELSASYTTDEAYERIIRRLIDPTYPGSTYGT